MAVFSTNANRQLYVVEAFKSDVKDVATTGDIAVKTLNNGVDKELYFIYKGADTILKSDRIQLKNINYVKAISAEKLRTPLKSVTVTLGNEDGTAPTSPVSGQDYILRIELRQWIGMSDEDVYFKEGVVHAIANMTAQKFYEAMAKSLNMAFSREIGASKDSNPYLEFAASADGLTITEKAQTQNWSLGTDALEPVYFEAVPTHIYSNGEEVIWGTATTAAADTTTDGKYVKNGYNIADLEYFCMGERGDQYRNVGWPNVIPTKYLVTPTAEYNVLEIHFGFTDTGTDSYRSEKDITIVCSKAEELNKVVKAINTAAELSVKGTDGEVPA